jgi:hypothetical protein
VRLALAGLAACWLAASAWAGHAWSVVEQTTMERLEVDLASLGRQGDRVRFHQRRTPLGGRIDPNTQRRVREVLEKRVVDCRKHRIATRSRAVFDFDDALIDHQVVRGSALPWQPLAADDALARKLCGGL